MAEKKTTKKTKTKQTTKNQGAMSNFIIINTGDLATVASRQQSVDADINRSAVEKDKNEDTDIQNGRLSVFVHKREDQFSHEVIQPLLR